MDVIMYTHVIPFIGTLIEVMIKNQIQLEMYMYFDELMHIATITYFEISADTMQQYVVCLAAINTMMHMLAYELEKGAK